MRGRNMDSSIGTAMRAGGMHDGTGHRQRWCEVCIWQHCERRQLPSDVQRRLHVDWIADVQPVFVVDCNLLSVELCGTSVGYQRYVPQLPRNDQRSNVHTGVQRWIPTRLRQPHYVHERRLDPSHDG